MKTGKQINTELVTKRRKMTEGGQLKEAEETSWVEFWPHEAYFSKATQFLFCGEKDLIQVFLFVGFLFFYLLLLLLI